MLTRKDRTIYDAEEELKKSMDMAYRLYFSLFKLMVDITSLQDTRLDIARNKYLPTEEELNPNMRFVDNAFIAALVANGEFDAYINEYHITWEDNVYTRVLLDKILKSDIYEQYMALETTDFATDAEFWRNVMKNIVFEDEGFFDMIESKSVYWNDDLSIVGTFFLKTIKRWGEGEDQTFLPQFKNDEDARFGKELLYHVYNNMAKYNELIDRYVNTDSWDADRIALMDRVIMLTDIAEIINYPLIPVNVSMNEYIEIAKFYSSPRSSNYINGLMSSVVAYLRKTNVLQK